MTIALAFPVPGAGPQKPAIANAASSEQQSSAADETPENGAGQEPEFEIPFRQRPYRINVEVCFSGDGRGNPGDRVRLLEQIREAVARIYGSLWDARVHECEWLRPGTIGQISRLTVADEPLGTIPLTERYPESTSDKAMLLSIESSAAGFRVGCREYDTRSQDLTPLREEQTPDVWTVPLLAGRLMRDSFRPCLLYVRRFTEDGGEEFIEMEVQGGEIPPPDSSADQIAAGDVLRPFLRHMERRDPTRLRQLQPLPLTWIRVVSVDRSVTRGLTTGVLLSHSPASQFGRRGRRAEHYALRQRPVGESTVVRLTQRGQEQLPLVCHRVSVVSKLRSTDGDEGEQLQLLSDRQGRVTVPISHEHPTRWLYVYSGQLLLARVPCAPGVLPTETVLLPDDSIRLSVEGDLQLFTDKLIDAVALREVHLSLAKKAAAEGRPADLERHLADYRTVPGRAEFLDSLAMIRVAAIRRTQEKSDRRAEFAVRRLCQSMEESLALLFSEEKRLESLREADELRLKAGLP